MEKNKKEKKDKNKKNKKEKKDKNPKKLKTEKELKDKQVVSYWPLCLPYFECYMLDNYSDVLKNTNVPKIIISRQAEDPGEWSSIVDMMSQNKSITSIVVTDANLDWRNIDASEIIRRAPDSLKEFVLQYKKQQHRITLTNFRELCNAIREKQSLERIGFIGLTDPKSNKNYAIRDLVKKLIEEAKHIKSYTIDDDCYEPYTLEALASARNITELSLNSLTFIHSEDQKLLKNIMGRLKSLSLKDCDVSSISNLADLGESRTLTSLSLDGVVYGKGDDKLMQAIISLKDQLEELSLSNMFAETHSVILDLLKGNKTLTKLSLTNMDTTETRCEKLLDALHSNTTLTHLSFALEKLTSESLGKYLQTNRSLKTLELKRCMQISGLQELAEALEVNTSLTSLHIQRRLSKLRCDYAYDEIPYNGMKSESASRFIAALTRNKTLINLSFDFESRVEMTELFFFALRNNPNLRQLSSFLEVIYSDQNPFGHSDWRLEVHSALVKKLVELLQSNISLKSLQVAFASGFANVGADHEVLEQLHKNRATRNAWINQVATIMKMAAIRPNFLGTHLPLEVWRIIFSFFDLDEIDVNAATLFSKIVSSFE